MRPLLALLLLGCGNTESPASPNVADANTIETSTDVAPEETPTAAGRTLGLEINPPDGSQYVAKLDEAIAVGVKGIPQTLPWGFLLEKEPTKVDASWFKLLSDVLATRPVRLSLSIPFIDTVSNQAPTDLQALSLDDPKVIARYNALLDTFFATVDPKLRVSDLIVSNEADVYLASKPDAQWVALGQFVTRVRDHVHIAHPAVRVGVNVTFGGVVDGARKAKVKALADTGDVVFISYYFGANGFGAPVGTAFNKDLDAMVAFAAGKPLALKELGYPTGVTGHSPAQQADFVRDVFAAWDKHGAKVEWMTFSRFYDGERKNCEREASEYGAPGNEEFIQFLCTLGLRTAAGDDKPGWAVFRSAASARGF